MLVHTGWRRSRTVLVLTALLAALGLQVALPGVAGAASCVSYVQWTGSAGKTYTTSSGLCIENPTYPLGRLKFQTDGNFVLYQDKSSGWTAVWSSKTNGRGQKLVFKTSGDIAVLSSSNTILWHNNKGSLGSSQSAAAEVGETSAGNACWAEEYYSYGWKDIWYNASDTCFGTRGSG